MVPQNVVLGTPSPTTTPQEDMGTKTATIETTIRTTVQKMDTKTTAFSPVISTTNTNTPVYRHNTKLFSRHKLAF